MPEIKITTTVKCQFRDQRHLETIVETAKEGNAQVLTNILMLATGSKIKPSISMLVEQIGHDDREIDIVEILRSRPAYIPADEDPFA